MAQKRRVIKKEIDKVFKLYNGSACVYEPPKTSRKSVASICASGSGIAAGTSIGQLLTDSKK